MPDFSSLLRKPAGEAKKPQALPVGSYSGVVKSFEVGDNNKNKTPYVRFHLALTDWPENVDDADRSDESGSLIDLSKRQLRRDYYLTDDALFRLDDFLRSVGIELANRSYEETVPEAVGAAVLIDVQQYVNQTNGELGNQVGSLAGAGS